MCHAAAKDTLDVKNTQVFEIKTKQVTPMPLHYTVSQQMDGANI
jgi:hypothetical protein